MYQAASVAQVFLDLARADNKSLTNMQLQKLVYFAHGIHLSVHDGQPLIKEHVKAWNFGPVIPELYEALRKYGSGPVKEIPKVPTDLADDIDALKVIEKVWNTFKGVSAAKLSDISHAKDSPWDIIFNKENKKFCDITDDITQKYYDRLVRKI